MMLEEKEEGLKFISLGKVIHTVGFCIRETSEAIVRLDSGLPVTTFKKSVSTTLQVNHFNRYPRMMSFMPVR